MKSSSPTDAFSITDASDILTLTWSRSLLLENNNDRHNDLDQLAVLRVLILAGSEKLALRIFHFYIVL